MAFDNHGSYGVQLAVIKAIAPKIGSGRDTLRRWVQQEETDAGHRDGVTPEERVRIKDLVREARELRQANEILKKAHAYLAPALIAASDDCRAAEPSPTAC